MKQLASIAWKEWHELRIFLWIALGIFVGLPIAGGIEERIAVPMRAFEIQASVWVVLLGGILAVFVGVGASCRDFNGHLEDFWRSRPVGIVPWIAVKYLIGLLIILASCLLPVGLEYLINHGRDFQLSIMLYPFLFQAIYSLAFLGGCLVRRTAHAAMLGISLMLLVYFLPMILPPLAWLDIAEVEAAVDRAIRKEIVWRSSLDNLVFFKFAASTIGIGIISLVAAITAVRRDLHIDSGRKMMYGSVSAALLILFCSAGFQLGTNLPVVQQADIPTNEGSIRVLQFDGQRGFVVMDRFEQTGMQTGISHYTRHTIDLNAYGLQIRPAEIQPGWNWGYQDAARSADHPEIGYDVDDPNPDKTGRRPYMITIIEQDKPDKTIQLPWEYDPENANQMWPRKFALGNRLFVYGDRLITLDISDPRTPVVIGNEPFNYTDRRASVDEEQITFQLPELPNVPPNERLRAVILSAYRSWQFDGKILCCDSDDKLMEFRLRDLTNRAANFERIAEYKPTMLEQLFGRINFNAIQAEDGLLFVQQGYGGGTFAPLVTVFETSESHPLHQIGHFAIRGMEMFSPLPDGRALVAGGGKLMLVGPPPR